MGAPWFSANSGGRNVDAGRRDGRRSRGRSPARSPPRTESRRERRSGDKDRRLGQSEERRVVRHASREHCTNRDTGRRESTSETFSPRLRNVGRPAGGGGCLCTCGGRRARTVARSQARRSAPRSFPFIPAFLDPRLGHLQGRHTVSSRHWPVHGHRPEPTHVLRSTSYLIDAADIPLAAGDDVVRAVFVDPGAKTGSAELKGHRNGQWFARLARSRWSVSRMQDTRKR
jgi:hypothetical protein